MFTAYELMQRRFGPRIRKFTAATFLILGATALLSLATVATHLLVPDASAPSTVASVTPESVTLKGEAADKPQIYLSSVGELGLDTMVHCVPSQCIVSVCEGPDEVSM